MKKWNCIIAVLMIVEAETKEEAEDRAFEIFEKNEPPLLHSIYCQEVGTNYVASAVDEFN